MRKRNKKKKKTWGSSKDFQRDEAMNWMLDIALIPVGLLVLSPKREAEFERSLIHKSRLPSVSLSPSFSSTMMVHRTIY
jgi:hypothetical protein